MFNDKNWNQNNMKECDKRKSNIGRKLRKNPEERRPHLYRGGSLKSPRISLLVCMFAGLYVQRASVKISFISISNSVRTWNFITIHKSGFNTPDFSSICK